MKFDKIVIFNFKDFNKNKQKDDCFPKDGEVISVYFENLWKTHVVAVGYC